MLSALGLFLALSAPMAGPATLTTLVTPTYVTGNFRGGNAAVYVRPRVYDYAPSIMREGSLYRMWWCGGIAGDHILYAEADSLDGPWHGRGKTAPNSYDDVFAPTYSPNDWDGQHTCDPSVVHANGSYWLYYGGFPKANSTVTKVTALGVAQSPDGLNWRRVRSTPVVSPARSQSSGPNKYGAGQPSAIFMTDDAMMYLAFTDTTGPGTNQVNGAGIFVWRSKDPTFQTGVQEFKASGWAPLTASAHSTFSVADAFSVSWGFSPTLTNFVMATTIGRGAHIRTFSRSLTPQGLPAATIPGPVMGDGPGLVTDRHGQLPAMGSTIPLDILYAVSDGSGDTTPNGWDIAHVGLDWLLAPNTSTSR